MATDSKIDRLEGRIDEISQRLASLETGMNARFNNLESRLDARFNTLLVVTIGLWATTIGTIVGFFLTR